MPRKKWIDKKNATHFTVVHRQQNDPLIHDESAPAIVLNPTSAPNSSKVKKLDDLASELGPDATKIRENEGEAANYGIYYDDTEYDYMQHMRDLGRGGGDATFVEAKGPKNKGKEKQSLEDALKNASLDDRGKVVLDDDILPSKNLRKVTYQAQQDVPDALAGFQPDMDPRLREVLEALEDEAYVDDDDEIFGELAQDGEEVDEEEFEQAWDDDDGWESDATAKPTNEFKDAPAVTQEISDDVREDHGDGDWMANFSKFKKDQKVTKAPAAPSQSDQQSSLFTTTTMGGRRKKRKGALTNPSAYSMTSSSLFRTEGLTTLDARFEVIEEQYNEDFDDMASVSIASSTASSVQGDIREDFNSIMDDFLGSHSMSGKKNVKKGRYQTGMEQLDEVRKGLGPARIMLLNGSNARGARGNSKSTRGSRGRGQPSRGALNNSSGKCNDIPKLPAGPRALVDSTNSNRGKSRDRGSKHSPWISQLVKAQRNYSRRSKHLATPSPKPPTTNPFEQERLENAAKREQRGQVGATATGRGGNAASRGGLHSNKQVRFANPPPAGQQSNSSAKDSSSEMKNPFATNTTAANVPNPFAPSTKPPSTTTPATANIFGAPTGPSAKNAFASPFTPATKTNIFGGPNTAQLSGSSPAFNPFASPNTTASPKLASPSFGSPSSTSSTPFASLNNSPKAGILKGNKAAKQDGSEKIHQKGTSNASVKKGSSSNAGYTGKQSISSSQSKSGPTASASSSSSASFASSSELASKITNLLRKEGISQPRCGARHPGDPSEKAAVKAYLDALKSYRTRVRASLIKAGFIDDPLKPKKLSDAIDFKGTCDQMCPEEETIRRIIEDDVQRAEKEVAPDGSLWPSPKKMIKKLARSAAGEDAPLPQDVRSPAALRQTLDYLIHTVLGEDGNLAAQHEFLWDRTRAIRRDFVFQSSMSPPELQDQVYCLEKITRFHVTALHQMSKPGAAPENFEEQQEVEQLSKSLLSLIHAYEDCNLQDIPCDNEAEFRAYYVLLNSSNPGILETVQNWGWKFWGESEEIKIAVSLVESLQNIWSHRGPLQPFSSTNVAQNAFSRFFTILKDESVSYTMACFAEMHFNEVRKNVFKTILSAYHRQRDQTKDWTLSRLNTYLHFDDDADVMDFGESYGLRFEEVDDDFCLSLEPDNQVVDPFPPLKQPHSESIVEQKRGDCSLTEVIDTTVYGEMQLETHDYSTPQDEESSSSEDGLFIKDSTGGTSTPAISTPLEPPKILESAVPQQPFEPSSMSVTPPAFKWSFGTPTSNPQTTESTRSEPEAQTPPLSATHATTAQADIQLTNTPSQPPNFSWPSSTASSQQLPAFSPTGPPKFPEPTPANDTTLPTSASPFSRPKLNAWDSSSKPVSQPIPSPVQQQPFSPPAQPSYSPQQSIGLPQQVSVPTSDAQTKEGQGSTFAALQPSSSIFQPQVHYMSPLDKFAEWIAVGEDGIIDQFTTYTVQTLLEETMGQFMREQARAARKEAKRIAKEEQELANKEADAFRSQSLAVKYFHMWITNANNFRLRRQGREARQARKEFAESMRASKAALSSHVVDDFRASARTRHLSMSPDERRPSLKRLLAAPGVMDVAHSPSDQFQVVVGNGNPGPETRLRKSSVSSMASDSTTYGHQRVQSDNPLRRSLLSDPSFLNGGSRIHLMPYYQAAQETRPQVSGVQTDYFRLKARGITTLPNGTPLATTAAKDVLHRKHSFDGISKKSARGHGSRIEKEQSIPRSSPARSFSQREINATAASDDEIERLKARAKEIMSKDFKPRGRLPKRGLDDDDDDLFERAKRIRERMDQDSEWLRHEVDRYSETRSGT
ncbi:low temperature viability protein [Rutstroemia sp. NJR-2017a BBW]|nr:low temperature viability protein [Rutstroemia sp. NJR-2017a BBW]